MSQNKFNIIREGLNARKVVNYEYSYERALSWLEVLMREYADKYHWTDSNGFEEYINEQLESISGSGRFETGDYLYKIEQDEQE
jgi:hypothetical protein